MFLGQIYFEIYLGAEACAVIAELDHTGYDHTQYGKVQRELPGSTLPLGGSPLELFSSSLPLGEPGSSRWTFIY